MIRVATIADAAQLAELAARTFREAYAASDSEADLDRYVAEHFTRAKMLWLLADPASTVLFAQEGETLIGYAHVQEGAATPACVRAERALELSRLYLTQASTGKGYGAALLQAVLEEARRRGCTALWLGVFSINQRAIRFYERAGFERVGRYAFVLGSKTYIDPVYVRAL